MTDLHMTFLQPSDIKRHLELDAQDAADDAAAAFEAFQDKRIAEEKAAFNAAEEAAAELRDAEPPDTIAAITNGLSPMRARLVRYVKWMESLQAEHDSLVAGRTAYLTAQKIPTLTKAAIAKLIEDDRSGLVGLMTSGGKGVSQHALRSHERQLLTAKLAGDQHAAETATAALIEVEAKTDRLAKAIEMLKARHGAFVADALSEIIQETAGTNLTAKMDALHDGALAVMGAHGALLALKGMAYEPRTYKMTLPTPRLAGDQWHTASDDKPGYYSSGANYSISFPVFQQQAEQKRWMEKAKLLMQDPHAKLTGAT